MAISFQQKKNSNPRGWLREWIETIVVAFVLAIIVRSFFLQVFWIPTGSMEPNLNINDRLIVNKLAYGIQNPLFDSFMEKKFFYIIPNPLFGKKVFLSDKQYFINFHNKPERFGVIVFRTYNKELERRDLIKRVIALPGEKVELRKGIIFINGKKLKENNVVKNDYYDTLVFPATFGPVTVPADSYFVMGDNRSNSADSRIWGFVPSSRLIGPAMLKIWPVWELGLI